MWRGKTLTVILPTYREKESIKQVIEAFEKLGICDEIIVINNNAEEGTSEEITQTSAREVHETIQGYGAAIKRGLRESNGDLTAICEPDSTFKPSDLEKLLVFTDQCEFVIGSRTVENFIWTGANMGYFLKWGNWFVAKLMELLFNSSSLSDVGCTFRVVSKKVIAKYDLERFKDDGRFGMEYLLSAVMAQESVVQVPVNYLPRIGVSGYTGNFKGAFYLGVKMIFLILRRRIGRQNYYFV
jgi:glycosyltransferase involved in cell wall biosynthesis